MSGKKGYEGCEVCGKELLLFKCAYCGKAFCEQHKAPEKHECAGMAEYRRQQAMGALARPGGNTDAVEKIDEPAEPSLIKRMYKLGVLSVKLLSVIAVTAASIMALVFLIGYINVNTPTWTESIPVSNATGAAVVLTNYKNATDPTWDSLMAFLKADDTSKTRYVFPNFTCADFARTLHDKAEAKGIRCGFVAIEFYNVTIDYNQYNSGDGNFTPPAVRGDVGHGINAFQTTDRGLVYVDTSSDAGYAGDQPGVRIAYVVVDKELNEIDLDRANNTTYNFYEDYKRIQLDFIADQRAFYKDLADYNVRLSVKNYTTAPGLKVENEQLIARAIELNARKSQIGPFYYPPGMVKKMDLYW